MLKSTGDYRSTHLFLLELPVSDVAEEIILSPSSMSSLRASSFFFAWRKEQMAEVIAGHIQNNIKDQIRCTR